MNRLDKQWDFCKALLGQQIGAEDSAAWLHSMRLEEILPGKVVFSGVPNSFFRNRILHQFRSLLLTTLGESFPEVALNPEPSLELRIGPHPVSGGAVPETPPNGTVTETVLGESIPMLAPARKEPAPVLNSKDTALTGRFRFEDFFTSPANASAVHFMREVVAQPGQRYNPLMLVGPSGLGKTHLLQAVANALRARHPEWPVLYRTGESFKNEVLEAITRRRTAPLRELFHTAQVLLLDDLEFMLVSPRAQEELMHLLDHLHRRGRQVIVSADRMPMLMTALGEPLRSRLEMGLITELGLPDEETRRRLVHSRAQGEGLTLDPEVVALLASRITTNLRRLEGAVIRLSAYATLHRRVITPEFALEMAAPFFDSDPVSGAVTAETLITRVAERFGLNPRELKGRSRSPNVTSARRMAVHLLKSEGRLSYPEIGTLLGNRSHSTIIHAHRTLLEELKHNAGLQAVVAQLRQPLGG